MVLLVWKIRSGYTTEAMLMSERVTATLGSSKAREITKCVGVLRGCEEAQRPLAAPPETIG